MAPGCTSRTCTGRRNSHPIKTLSWAREGRQQRSAWAMEGDVTPETQAPAGAVTPRPFPSSRPHRRAAAWTSLLSTSTLPCFSSPGTSHPLTLSTDRHRHRHAHTHVHAHPWVIPMCPLAVRSNASPLGLGGRPNPPAVSPHMGSCHGGHHTAQSLLSRRTTLREVSTSENPVNDYGNPHALPWRNLE